jgi:hypothetical protein
MEVSIMSALETVSVPRSRLANFVLATVAVFAAVFVAVHFLRSDVDLLAQMTDAYQQGAYSSIYKVAMLLFGAGQLALALGLYRALPGSIVTTIGVILLGYWAVWTLLVPILSVPQPGGPPTVMGTIAQINGPLHVLSLTFGAFLISWRFKDDEAWRPVRGTALILSIVMLLLFFATAATSATNVGIAGLLQRFFVILTLAWSTLVGLKLRKLVSS